LKALELYSTQYGSTPITLPLNLKTLHLAPKNRMGTFLITNFKEAIQDIQDLDLSAVALTQTGVEEVLNMNPDLTVSYHNNIFKTLASIFTNCS
jgi:hypothetical protein